MPKADPSKVNSRMADEAMRNSKVRGEIYSQYILLHYRSTGSLAPGCDAKDLFAWMAAYRPVQLAIIPRKGALRVPKKTSHKKVAKAQRNFR